jgi:hypothetical protein
MIINRATLSLKLPKYFRHLLALAILSASFALCVGMLQRSAHAYTAVRVLYKINASSTELYNTSLNTPFVPRGANFVRLATSSTGNVYHSVFEPGHYSPSETHSVITGMKNSGYNTIRVFIDPGEFTNPSHGISAGVSSNEPIRTEYMANVIDFVKQAGAKSIYTIPVIDGIPANNYYYKIAGSPSGNIQGNNVLYLDPRYVEAKETYVKEFVTALRAGLSPSERNAILAYATDNEVFFEGNKPPFNTMSGTLTSLDGVQYDMSKPDRRQQAADANLVVYSARMKAAITSADPQGLLTLGFFTNNAVSKTAFNGAATYCSDQCNPTMNYYFPGRPAAVSIYGKADFIDMHAYSSGLGYNLQTDLASSEYGLFQKPYILGEFGAAKASYNNDAINAAYAMRDLQKNSCSLQSKGWLFWTWDTSLTTTLAYQNTFYSLADNNGAINGQLAPVARPDPCK